MATRDIKMLGNLGLSGSLIFLEGNADFPTTGRIGQIILKDSQLFAYMVIGNMETWYPVSNKTNTYIHSQAIANSTWTVNHNLNTTDIWFQIRDTNGTIVYAPIESQTADSFTIVFTEPVSGNVVVVAPDSIDVPTVTTSEITVGNVHITGNDITINGNTVVTSGATGTLHAIASSGDFGDLENTPTTLDGYGITDAASIGHSHSSATTSASGFMSAADKTKLDGIAVGATNYSLPHATDTVLGGIKVGARLSIDVGGVLSADDQTCDWSEVTSKPTTLAGYGITDAQGLDADLTAIATLAGASGFLKKTATNTWSLDTSTYLTGNQTVTLSGDVAGSGSTSISVTLANSGVNAGTYNSVTVDAKGRVTAGTNPTTLAGYGITDAQGLDADLTAIATLAGSSGFLKKTATNTWSLDTSTYLTGNQTVTLSGDVAGSGSTSISVTLANSGVTAGTYKSVTVDAKGRVTAGTNPTTLAGYGITDAAPLSHVSDASLHLTSAQNTWLDAITATSSEVNYLSGVTSNLQTQLNGKQALDADLTAIAALAGTSGILRKTAADTWALDTASYITGNQTVTITGDATGSGSTSIALTLANSGVTSGTYKSVTVDAKGRVTSGTNPTTLAGYGITDAQALDADLTAIAALAGTSGILKKTAANTWTLDTSTYLTGNQTVTVTGDATGSGSTSIALTLANSGVTAGTYNNVSTEVRPFTVDAKGRVTSIGSAVTIAPAFSSITGKPTTLTGYGITMSSGDVTTALGFTPENSVNKNQANGYAGLDANGKISSSTLPAIAITDTFVVASQAAMLALSTAETGDVAVRTDVNKSFILKGTTYSTLADWQELLTPTDSVQSVNGMTGVVSITTITGNAGTATALQTSRTISATGDASWSVSFNGSANATAALTLANSGVTAGTYNNVATEVRPFTVDAKGRVTSIGSAVTIAPAFSSITSKPTTLAGYGITDAQALDADLTAIAALAGTSGILKKTAANTWSLDTSTYLTGNQTVTITGDATGSGATSIALTLASTGVGAGTYKSVTVDAKGRVTAGTNPTTLAGYGITDAQALDADLTAIAGLVATSGILRKTAANTWTLDTSTYLTGNQTVTVTGDATGSGSTSIALTLASTGVGAGTYKSVTVDAKGRVTAGTNPTTLAGYGITDAQALDADLTAIAALVGTSGILRKTAADTWTLDTSTYLTGNQTVTVTGDATGSGATSIALTLANSGVTAGTYNNSATSVRPFTVDAKGRVTSIGTDVTIAPAFSSITSKPTTLSGYGITDAQALDADLTAIAALAGTTGFLKKTAANTWTLDTSTYLTGNQTITLSGDATGSGTTGVAVTLSNTGVSGGTYKSVTVDTKGRVTAGSNPTTLAGYGITDAASSSHTHTQIVNGNSNVNIASSNGNVTVNTNGALAATFSTAGDFTAVGNVTAYSDIRIKKDLVQIENAIEKVSALTGYTYTRIDSGERHVGLVAQDVEKVLPEAISDNGEIKSVAYGNMVALLVEAIKDQQRQIEELKNLIGRK